MTLRILKSPFTLITGAACLMTVAALRHEAPPADRTSSLIENHYTPVKRSEISANVVTTTHTHKSCHCSHCKQKAPTKNTEKNTWINTGALWESHANSANELTISSGLPTADSALVDSSHNIILEDGSQLTLKVEQRRIQQDGTVSIGGSLQGNQKGRVAMDWNTNADFFQGQVHFDKLPIGYQINRLADNTHTIKRLTVDNLMCSHVSIAEQTVSHGLASFATHSATAEAITSAAVTVPGLSSNPSAEAVIYLDFDGEQVAASFVWGPTVNAVAAELTEAQITEVWERVSADMEPFNIDVTTDESRYLNAPESRRIRCIITPSSSWYSTPAAGGVAMLNSFKWTGDTPCWVFSNNLLNNAKYVAEACSHEIGHTFGLNHDGNSSTAYYSGHGSGETGWAPIMGLGYYKERSQWSKGEYSTATNKEDDLSIITSNNNGFGYRSDDHGNTNGSARSIKTTTSGSFSQNGRIERQGDVDVFTLNIPQGFLSIDINPLSDYGNIDINSKLYNAQGTLLASSNPANTVNSNYAIELNAGTYYLHIKATGYGSAANGYTEYATLGSYAISGQTTVLETPYDLATGDLPEELRAAHLDADQDGLSNLVEHAIGSNPALAEINASFTEFYLDPQQGVALSIDLPNDLPNDVIYSVEASCSLGDDDWASIATLSHAGEWVGDAQISQQEIAGNKTRYTINSPDLESFSCRFLRVRFDLSTQ